MDWPANPFWDYAVDLYRRPGVEAACLDLQERHGLDVDIVLLCCWLGSRGIVADALQLSRIAATAAVWQEEVVRPLRAVRRRLKARLAEAQPGSIAARWPEFAAALRQRTLNLEIDGERLEQLLLAELAADLAPTAPLGVASASANLRRYHGFAAEDRRALATLLRAAFPGASRRELAASVEWLEPRARGGQRLPPE